MSVPITAPGIIVRRIVASQRFHHTRNANTSINSRIGSMIAAALTGAIVSDISGTPTMPTPPPRPPFAMPTISTATIAQA